MAGRREKNAAAARKDEGRGGDLTPLLRARAALRRGNNREARKLAAEAAAAGPESERAEARELALQLQPDPRSLLAAGGALLLIAFAAWAAILRH